MRRLKPPSVVFWLSLVILSAMLVLIGLRREPGADRDAEDIRAAVLRAAVLCYALEGEYPMSETYLEEHYGLVYDKSRYIVRYATFARNIRPDVLVVPIPG